MGSKLEAKSLHPSERNADELFSSVDILSSPHSELDTIVSTAGCEDSDENRFFSPATVEMSGEVSPVLRQLLSFPSLTGRGFAPERGADGLNIGNDRLQVAAETAEFWACCS